MGNTMENSHDSRPLFVEISEYDNSAYSVHWKTPSTVSALNRPDIILPQGCKQGLHTEARSLGRRAQSGRAFYRCANNLGGKAVEVQYPLNNPSLATLVRIHWLSGQTGTVLSTPDNLRIELPLKESRFSVVRERLGLGITHILTGYDYLIFLVCLLIIAGAVKYIL